MYPTAVITLHVAELPWFSRWSYTVGIKNVQLNIKWNQNDCIKNERDVTNFAGKFTEHIVRKLNLVTMYEAYFSFKRASFEKPKRTCQVMKDYIVATNSNNGEFIKLRSLYFTLSLSICMFAWFCYNFRPVTPFSQSFILHRIFWKENGKMICVIRRFVIASVWVYSNFLIILNCQSSEFLVLSFLLFVLIPSVLFTFDPLLTTTLKGLNPCLEKSCLTSKFFFVSYCCHFSCFVYKIVRDVVFSIAILVLWLEMTFLVYGLLLNLNYFFPYFASLFVFIFYWSNYHKTIEKKYAVSKRLILEACRETKGITIVSLPSANPKQSNGVLTIMLEELLPYYTELLYVGKMCLYFFFSCGIFKFAGMESEFNFVLCRTS